MRQTGGSKTPPKTPPKKWHNFSRTNFVKLRHRGFLSEFRSVLPYVQNKNPRPGGEVCTTPPPPQNRHFWAPRGGYPPSPEIANFAISRTRAHNFVHAGCTICAPTRPPLVVVTQALPKVFSPPGPLTSDPEERPRPGVDWKSKQKRIDKRK